jgi:hypothetical protein
MLLVFTLLALAACGGNSDTETQQPQNDPATQAPSENIPQPPEPTRVWTIEELGTTIVTAGGFWEDWWDMRGGFAAEHLDFAQVPTHISEVRGLGIAAVLPTSAFGSLDGIRNFLLQFYTENWVGTELSGEFAPFLEYNGILFADATRIGSPRPNWETATHTLIEQDGSHAVVETKVLWGSWHRINPENIMEIRNPWEVTYHFTFIDGKIDSPGRMEMQEQAFQQILLEEEYWPPLEVSVEPFSEAHLDIDRFVNYVLFSFRDALYAHDGVWRQDGYGERLTIFFNRPVWDFEILLLSSDFVNDQLEFAVLERFPVTDQLWVGEAVFAWDYYEFGTLPWSGFSFEYSDDNGVLTRRYYTLLINQGYPETGGFWNFREFEPYGG